MFSPQDTLVFLPVLNQERELPLVLSEINAAGNIGADYLLIDNGSTDGSSAIIRDSGLPFVREEQNRGVGHAYKLALEAARKAGCSILSGLAANGKMVASELPRLLSPIRSGEADYVTGSRFLEGGHHPNLPWFRRSAIPVVSAAASLLSGKRVTDATNGFRAYRLDLLDFNCERLQESWLETYSFEYYVYAKALMTPGIRCVEVPTTMRYPTIGPYTKIRPGADWFAMLRPWIIARYDGVRLWNAGAKA